MQTLLWSLDQSRQLELMALVWTRTKFEYYLLTYVVQCLCLSFVYILRLHLMLVFTEQLTIAVFIDMQSSSSKCSINRTLKGPLKKAKKRVCVVCGLGYWCIGLCLGLG